MQPDTEAIVYNTSRRDCSTLKAGRWVIMIDASSVPMMRHTSSSPDGRSLDRYRRLPSMSTPVGAKQARDKYVRCLSSPSIPSRKASPEPAPVSDTEWSEDA